MLDPASFLEQAQSLPEGGRQRFAHDCGDGRTLIVDHKVGGWGAFCWRCNEPGWVPKPAPTMAERLARIQKIEAAEAAIERDLRPPTPANFDPSSWPLEARVWLYKAGLSNERIEACGIYYHEGTSRVVLPVIEKGKLVYWQARGFDKSRAKYINPAVDSKPLYEVGDGTIVVLTEDILSAIRVGEVTHAISMLGTSITTGCLLRLQALSKPVVVWLDPDGPGRRAKTKVLAQLRLVGLSARAVVTARDPKLYSKEEIASVLGLDTATIAPHS